METYFSAFATFFRKYRQLSGFITLSKLADAMADYGVVCDESLLSKWQQGKRVPSRDITLFIASLFIKNKAINSLNEVHCLLDVAGHSCLTEAEAKILSIHF